MAEQRFDRAAAERILQRAIELEDVRDPSGVFDGLSEEALREAAAELGVPADVVRQAAAEERLGVLLDTARRLDRLVGPASLVSVRIVEGDRAEVMTRADEWLRRSAFRRRRFSTGSAEYTRRNDPVATAQRALRSVGGQEALSGLANLKVTAEPLGDDVTVLALVVPMQTQRTAVLASGGAVAGGGVAASAITAALTTPYVWLGIPASAAAGYGILRARVFSLRDTQTTLDGAMDRIAASDLPTSGLAEVGQRVLRQAAKARIARG